MIASSAWTDDDVSSLPDGLYSYEGTLTDEPNGGDGGFNTRPVLPLAGA